MTDCTCHFQKWPFINTYSVNLYSGQLVSKSIILSFYRSTFFVTKGANMFCWRSRLICACPLSHTHANKIRPKLAITTHLTFKGYSFNMRCAISLNPAIIASHPRLIGSLLGEKLNRISCLNGCILYIVNCIFSSFPRLSLHLVLSHFRVTKLSLYSSLSRRHLYRVLSIGGDHSNWVTQMNFLSFYFFSCSSLSFSFIATLCEWHRTEYGRRLTCWL